MYYYLTWHDLNFKVLGLFEFSQLWNEHSLSKVLFEWMSELNLPLVNPYTNRSYFSFSTLLLLNPKSGPVHPALPISIQANSKYLILRRLARLGLALLSAISTLYSLYSLYYCTQVSHLLLSRHKKCCYWAPIIDIDPKCFGLSWYNPYLKLGLV